MEIRPLIWWCPQPAWCGWWTTLQWQWKSLANNELQRPTTTTTTTTTNTTTTNTTIAETTTTKSQVPTRTLERRRMIHMTRLFQASDSIRENIVKHVRKESGDINHLADGSTRYPRVHQVALPLDDMRRARTPLAWTANVEYLQKNRHEWSDIKIAPMVIKATASVGSS